MRRGSGPGYDFSANGDLYRRRCQEAHDRVQQSRFSASAGTGIAEEFAFGDFELMSSRQRSCSIVGAGIHAHLADIDRESVMNWPAAGPIAIFGSPTRTWLGARLPRVKVLYFVAGFASSSFCGRLQQTAHGTTEWIFVALAISIAMAVLFALDRIGQRRERCDAVGPSPIEMLSWICKSPNGGWSEIRSHAQREPLATVVGCAT
jgi:hypothetical protein